MNDIYSLLKINKGVITDFSLQARRVIDSQTDKVIKKNIAVLKKVEEQMSLDKGLVASQYSIDQVIAKVIRLAPTGNISSDNWTTRELRIVSYYLMKLRDNESIYNYALELLDRNWKNIFFNGLVFYLMNSWYSIEPHFREMTSRLLTNKLAEYSDSNRKYLLWKNKANLFENNGPTRMAAMVEAKRMNIEEAPTLLGYKKGAMKQPYYSDVVVKYVENNHISDRRIIEQIFMLHDHNRTKKLIFAYLVEEENKICDVLRRSQLCRFANECLGDITLAQTWAPFLGATESEIKKLEKAMQLVNLWFAQQIIETFFEMCVQDKARKNFWLNYVSHISAFKIIGSTATKHTLQGNSTIGPMLMPHFIETNSLIQQTSALVLFIKDKMIVEFSDLGSLYVYNNMHYMVKRVTNPVERISTINNLKVTSMGHIVERDCWGNFTVFNEEGKMPHIGDWQTRLRNWLDDQLLKSKKKNVSLSDHVSDDIYKIKPVLEENFKPIRQSYTNEENIEKKSQTRTNISEFPCVIQSKTLDNNIRVVANSKGFFLTWGTGIYKLIGQLNPYEQPTGNIWIKKTPKLDWYEIVHHKDSESNKSIGFIRIVTDGVIYKEQLYVPGQKIFKF
ncbi:hypothetical protein JQM83_01295 [Parabacteroides distasonis]|nr:hypothetical protein [Parabacteroides distasonis]